MSQFYFIGDGTEVLACEAWEANARARLKELQETTDDTLNLYQCDPCELTRDDSIESGKWVWQYPSERAAAEADYDLPTLEQCIERETANA